MLLNNLVLEAPMSQSRCNNTVSSKNGSSWYVLLNVEELTLSQLDNTCSLFIPYPVATSFILEEPAISKDIRHKTRLLEEYTENF